MDDKESLVPVEQIERYILLIRGEKVILDADLAALYGVTTKVLVQAVKRHQKRFPADFMFHSTEPGGVRPLEVTICDLKSMGRAALTSIRLYGARRGYVIQRSQQPQGHPGEHRDHAGLYPAAPDDGLTCRTGAQVGEPGKEVGCPI
jgi:hypothetical protein